MKYTIIVLSLILLTINCKACFAQSQFSATLSLMEKSIFGIDYSNQDDGARLTRLEKNIYGQASSSAIKTRVNKLSKDINADLISKQVKPKVDTFEEDEESIKESIPKEDSSVNYPIVDKLEKEAFNKNFKGIDIQKRLSNLEEKVFRKAYDQDSLNSRVERLRVALIPESKRHKEIDTYNDEYLQNDEMTPDDIIAKSLPNGGTYYSQKDYNSNNSVSDDYDGTSDIQVPLTAIEKTLLKKTFPNDTVPNRLSRLEAKMFKNSFAQDDEQTRLDRVASAYQAKKSAKKYDSNKFSQHMSTAMQIGAMVLMVLVAIL